MNKNNAEPGPNPYDLFWRAHEAMLSALPFAPGTMGARDRLDPARVVETVREKVADSQERAFTMLSSLAHVWQHIGEHGLESLQGFTRVLEETRRSMEASWPGLSPSAATRGESAQRAADAWLGLLGGDMSSMFSAPGFGLAREYQTRMGDFLKSFQDFQKKDFEYRLVLSKAWAEAFQALVHEMAAKTRAGQGVQSPRELVNLWVEVADGVFTELFQTEEFSRLQSEMLNRAHHLRRIRQRLSEDALRAHDIPTRTELETAHRAIYELRKQVRTLKREVAKLRPEASA